MNSASSSKPFADVEALNVILALPPLLSGTLEAKSIELDQPMLRLKIDEFGEGTWQSIGPHGLDIPMPVREVVLNNVADQGRRRRAAATARKRPPGAIDHISGTFSADSLTGPFHFAGSATTGGDEREIKLSAGADQGRARCG